MRIIQELSKPHALFHSDQHEYQSKIANKTPILRNYLLGKGVFTQSQRLKIVRKRCGAATL
jgi:hypothetical protein